MAQTSVAYSMKNCRLEISTNGTTWTDISGFSNEVSWDGGERDTEGTPTFDGDTKLLTTGKRDLVTVTAKVVYTEGASDPVNTAQSAFEADTDLYLRWSPRGGSSGQRMYTTSAGRVKKPTFPQGATDSASAILVEIQLVTPNVTVSTVA